MDNEAIVARYWLAREQAWELCIGLKLTYSGYVIQTHYLFLINFFEKRYPKTLAETIKLCNRNGKTGEVYK